jgi:choline dehydrogenase-like flavoprotein
MAKEVLMDDRGRARGVAYYDADGRLQEQACDIVIVSACAIESARLLLNSKSRLFPNGLGNRHDQVGRHLQGHHYTGAIGFFDFDTYDDVGPGASIAVADYNHGTPGLCGGGALCNEFIRLPIQMVERMPVNTPRWGLGHKQAMRTFYKRNIAVMGPTQPIPMADGRITLDPAVTDKWGMPVARISGNVHPHTFEIGLRQAQRAEAWLKEAGAMSTIVNAGKPTIVSGGQHQAGTCRMGNDPQGSVVNRDCQVHDADNVFVIDGSVHVTNGGFNPALTIMAIAYMASETLVRNWKGTGFKS